MNEARMGGLAVDVEKMTRRFGGGVAVDAVTFGVRRREIFGLIGPDGAGKTTTLRVVLGLLRGDSGRVTTCGLDPIRQGRELSRKVGYLSQRFSLYGDLSVDENISFFAEVHGERKWKPRREQLLEMLRLGPFRNRLADKLSGGMRQKLALACTLIHRPELLVLDEPTTGVDPVSRRDFWKILVQIQREGLTILLTTPYLDEAERCQRVGLIHHGRLLTVDSPEALRGSAGDAVIELLARPKRRAIEILRERRDLADVQTFGERLHVRLEGVSIQQANELARGLAGELKGAGIEVESARATAPSLEDIFIARILAAGTDPGAETAGAAGGRRGPVRGARA